VDTAATRTQAGGAAHDIVKNSLAIKRIGQPEDMVGACLFLLSDEASWIPRRSSMSTGSGVPGMSQARVGFIGLGNIGSRWPAAGRVGGRLTVFDIAPEPLPSSRTRRAGRVLGSRPGCRCGVISVMVNTDEQVRDVMGEILGAAKAGTGGRLHSTSRPTPPRLEDLTGRHDLLFVDAAGQRRRDGCGRRTLAIMVGGTDAAFAAVSGPFALMGTRSCMWPAGNGTAAKLPATCCTSSRSRRR